MKKMKRRRYLDVAIVEDHICEDFCWKCGFIEWIEKDDKDD